MADVVEPIDGRIARRERNITNVIDVVLEMFAEDALFPTIEQTSKRSGLSLRSLYRYFADPAEMVEAAIVRSRERAVAAAHLHAIGEGPLQQRIDDFVAMRLRVYEVAAPVYRATVANAAHHPRVAGEQAATRELFREQLVTHFATELDRLKPAERDRVTNAADVLTQLDSVNFLCTHRALPADEASAVLTSALTALLAVR